MDTRGPASPYCCEDGLKSSSEADGKVLFYFLFVYVFVLIKMVILEASAFPLPISMHVQILHGTILSERNPDTSWVRPTHQAIEETPTSKCVGKADTHFRHHPDLSMGLYLKFPVAHRGEESLDSTSSTPTFKAPIQLLEPQNTKLWKPERLA